MSEPAYRLSWSNWSGRTSVLTADRAAALVSSWTGRGVLTGSLPDGHVTFKLGGRSAVLTRKDPT